MRLSIQCNQLSARLSLVLCVTGCSARGYSGPARPAEEVATISVHTVGEITIEDVTMDGHPISSLADNVEVLPGTNSFRINYSIEDKRNCDPHDYYCLPIVVTGVCEGSVESKPGRTYLLTIENKFSLVSARVSAKGYFDFSERSDEPNPGAGTCQDSSAGAVIY